MPVTDPDSSVRGLLSSQQRRDLLALLCRVAWADGSVGPTQTARLTRMRQQLAVDALSAEELQAWLRVGPPDISARLPARFKQAFHDSALAVISQDGACHPHEVRVIREVLQQCFERSSAG